MVGASAVIFDETGEKILLTRRTDNNRWCLPGGRVDSGESVAEACTREVLEETGLVGEVVRLTGIYSNPNLIVTYPDGNRFQLIAFNFIVRVTGGTLGLSDETTEYGYYTLEEMDELDLMEHHHERIKDALTGQEAAIVK